MAYDVTAVLKANISQFSAGMKAAKNQIDGLKGSSDKSLGGLENRLKSTGSMFKSMLGANVIGSGITKGIGLITDNLGSAIDRFDTLKKYPVVMQALGYSAKDTAKATKILSDGIDGLPTTLDGITKISQQLAPLTGSASKASKSAIALNNAFLSSGASAGDASRGLQQYTQMLSTGKVDMMSWRTLQETMPIALRKTAKAFGFTGKAATNDLYNALKDGSITIDQLNDKFIELNKGQNGFAALAKKNSAGIGTSFTNLKNTISKNLANVVTDIDKAFTARGMGNIATQIDKLKNVVNSTFSAIGPYVTNFGMKAIDVFTQISSKAGQFWQSFSNTGAVQAFVSAIQSAGAAISHVWDSLTASSVLQTLGSVLGNVVNWLSQAAKAAGDFVNSLPSGVIQGIAGAIIGIKTALFAVKTGVKALDFISAFNPFKLFAKNSSDGLGDVVKNATGSRSKVSQIMNALANDIRATGTAIKSSLQGVGAAAKGIGQGIGAALKGLMQGLKALNPAQIISFGASFAVAAVGIGAAVAIIAAGFALLATQSQGVSQIISSIGSAISGVATAIIGALANAAVTVAPVMQTIANALVTLTPVIDSVAQGISKVVTSIASGLSQVATAITPIVAIIGNTITQVAQIIANAVVQIVQALTPLAPLIAQTVQAIAPSLAQIATAFSSAFQAIPGILNAAKGVIQTTFEGIKSTITTAASGIKTVLTSFGNAFKSMGTAIKTALSGVSGVINSFANLIKSVLNGVANVFTSIGTAAKNAGLGIKLLGQGLQIMTNLKLGDLAGTLATVATGLTGIVGSGIGTAGQGLMLAGQGLMLLSTAAMVASTALAGLPAIITTFSTSIQGIDATLAMVSTAMTAFATSATASLNGLLATTAIITQFTTSLMTVSTTTMAAMAGLAAFNAQATAAGAAMSVLGAQATMAGQQLTMMGSTISTAMSTATTAVRMAGTNMSTAMQNSMNLIRSTVRSGMTQAASAVRNGVSEMVASMRAGVGQMTSAAQNMVNSSVSAIRSGYGNMYSAGAYLVQGVAAGMNSALGAVTAAANKIVAEANRAAQAAAKIHSPSRLFRDEVGYFIGAGIAKGIDRSSSLVADSLASIATMTGGFGSATAALVSDMNLNMSAQPASVTHTINNSAAESRLISKIDELIKEVKNGSKTYLDGAVVADKVDRRLGEKTTLGGRFAF